MAIPRRVLATRDAAWAKSLARWLARIGARPNAVSIAGIVFALCAGLAFYFFNGLDRDRSIVALLAAAASIQLRLLCNLLDGMLAVEEGFKGKTGEMFNDLPDRVADIFILVGAGYATRHLPYSVVLGWTAAVLALFTAYVRLLGASLGLTQQFIGPMAKQHRMFTLTIATLVSVVETLIGLAPRGIGIGLGVIVGGSIVTVVRRTLRIAGEMEAR
jgi:phosphatidylglycerophosphate synthase